MSDGDGVLDLVALDELRDILEEGLDELIDEYFDDTRQQLLSLRSAVDTGDLDAINSISHTLKGSSGNLGISSVYEICAVLEQEAKAGVMVDAKVSLRTLETTFDKAKSALRCYLRQ